MREKSVNRLAGIGILCAAALLQAGGNVAGTVKYEGKIPKLMTFDMTIEPVCVAKHEKDPANFPSRSEALVLGAGNTMANIYVRVVGGLPDREWEVTETPAVLDQNGCQYKPHVLGVQVDQPVKFINSDGVLHNLHTLPEENDEFNVTMPEFLKETIKTFEYAEPPFRVKCDVHPWMGGFIGVTEHPFFDVTDLEGRFEISGLDAGTYQLEFWHEKLGTRTVEVVIKDDATSEVAVTFSR